MKKCAVVLVLLWSFVVHAAPTYELAIVSMFRDEAFYLKEWVEYHELAGVQHFWLYDNNSTDNFEEVLKPFIDRGLVEVLPFYQHASLSTNQVRAFRDGLKRAAGVAKWVAVVDLDEFLLPIGETSIPNALNRYFANASAVHVNWRNFGTGGACLAQGTTILPRLTVASLPTHSHNAVGKSIVRPETVDLINMWSPHHFPLLDGFYVNGSGQRMHFRGIDLPTDGWNHDQHLRINHYILRDDGFFHKVRLRQNRGETEKQLYREYYDSFCEVRDFAILDFIQNRTNAKE